MQTLTDYASVVKIQALGRGYLSRLHCPLPVGLAGSQGFVYDLNDLIPEFPYTGPVNNSNEPNELVSQTLFRRAGCSPRVSHRSVASVSEFGVSHIKEGKFDTESNESFAFLCSARDNGQNNYYVTLNDQVITETSIESNQSVKVEVPPPCPAHALEWLLEEPRKPEFTVTPEPFIVNQSNIAHKRLVLRNSEVWNQRSPVLPKLVCQRQVKSPYSSAWHKQLLKQRYSIVLTDKPRRILHKKKKKPLKV